MLESSIGGTDDEILMKCDDDDNSITFPGTYCHITYSITGFHVCCLNLVWALSPAHKPLDPDDKAVAEEPK